MADYVAPAAKALTVLHIRNPAAPDTGSDPWATADGQTLCGLDFETAELWQSIERLPGEKVCSRCENPGSGEGDQGTLL